MNNIIRLIRLKPSNELYSDALQSYEKIYNACMAKGAVQLEYDWLGGNPIQLDTNNMNSMLESDMTYTEYFISTKADGMRFMLFTGNKDEIKDNERHIYFIDSKKSFWYIKDLTCIPGYLNLDNILIDGELIHWGTMDRKMNGNLVDEYEITGDGVEMPLIGFLTFDILYGPFNPSYEPDTNAAVKEMYNYQRPDQMEGGYVYNLGSNGGMVGFKSLDRWPTTRRRHVLEQLFLNKNSNMYKFLHLESSYTLPHSSLAIFVSPFIKMKDMFDGKYSHKAYNEMISILQNSIRDQYFVIGDKTDVVPMTLPRGKIDTDGLIFTPAIENYLIGPWMLCDNKQYKWKPIGMLTIDFELGDTIKENFYHALVRHKNKRSKFVYKMDDIEYAAVISADEPVKKGEIYECLYSGSIDKKGKYIYFKMIKQRYDKVEPNPYLTAVSVLNAADLNDDLLYMKELVGLKTKPNILDFIIMLKEQKHTAENMPDIISSFGKTKLTKYYATEHPLIIFDKKAEMLKLIKTRQEDKTGLLELELRLNLATPFKIQPAYTNQLVRAFVRTKYTPVPMIKIYGNNSMRSLYTLIGPTVVLEETVKKTSLNTVHLSTDIFRYNYDFVISEEVREPAEKMVKRGSVQYQNRYTIMNLSKYWRVDIIEYGSDSSKEGDTGESIKRAKINYEQNRSTRIDIEYDPGHYIKDIAKWTPEALEANPEAKEALISAGMYGISDDIKDSVIKKYIDILNISKPVDVLKELGHVLINVFRVLDVDSPNYDKIKERNENPEKPVSQRVESNFERMTKFHNYIKLNMIINAAKKFKKPTLFDVSAGRGGDIDKWHKADINEVYAIDPDKKDINEAKKRLESKKYIKGRNYIFENATITDDEFKSSEKFNIVSCQFTVHYFFKNDEMLETAIRNISRALKIGGLFIGTTIIGDKVRQVVNNNKYPEYIQAVKVDENSYTWELLDSKETIYKKLELLEYYVDFEKFANVCKKYGLKLISYTPFSELYKNYKLHDLTDHELYVSKLYASFEFTKL